ncbi:MAG: nuclear transport factor 2 family protein [Candidatus Promineifilaceae bacterium]
MTSHLDTYRAYYDASRANPPQSIIEANKRYLADDFQSVDKEGNVQMDKAAYMGMTQLLFGAFDDFDAVVSDYHEEGDNVIVSSHFEGTQTGDLDLSAWGLGSIPSSGKRIVWPETSTRWSFRGDKITRIQENDDAGGLDKFLAALGMQAPGT